jgi:hypothetical protein
MMAPMSSAVSGGPSTPAQKTVRLSAAVSEIGESVPPGWLLRRTATKRRILGQHRDRAEDEVPVAEQVEVEVGGEVGIAEHHQLSGRAVRRRRRKGRERADRERAGLIDLAAEARLAVWWRHGVHHRPTFRTRRGDRRDGDALGMLAERAHRPRQREHRGRRQVVVERFRPEAQHLRHVAVGPDEAVLLVDDQVAPRLDPGGGQEIDHRRRRVGIDQHEDAPAGVQKAQQRVGFAGEEILRRAGEDDDRALRRYAPRAATS